MDAAVAEQGGTIEVLEQHLIDPEICIRCNTCEEMCPRGAITHDSRNYVVDAAKCDLSRSCIAPCPTGAIDNWRRVVKTKAYSLDDQLSWDSLPAQLDLSDSGAAPAVEDPADSDLLEDVARITAVATSGPSATRPPWSAAHPYTALYGVAEPAIATVTGNYRLSAEESNNDLRHIVLDFGTTFFPVLEGQSIGIVPPGLDARGKPHHVRLYSTASPRDGERQGYNNLALTVKRVVSDHDGKPVAGTASNYVCDLKKGDQVRVVGPYGTSFLMPNHPGTSIMMICTGTGSAPMRAITERRRRRRELNEGGNLMLFFGARRPEELPYFGPLLKLPKDFIDINFAFSRVPGQPKTYVQDKIRERAADVGLLLNDPNGYIYVCGLKGMEAGVDQAFAEVARQHGLDWPTLRTRLIATNRYHVETY